MTIENQTPSFQDKVNEAIGLTTRDEKGVLVIPDTIDEPTAFAVRAEVRRRDTQSALAKAQQENSVLKTTQQKLIESWESDAVANLSNTEQARLEELKNQDPDKWRVEITSLEQQRREAFKTKVDQISTETNHATELDRRVAILAAYNEEHSDKPITDDVIKNDIPPRIVAKLEKGEVAFEDFLQEVSDYLGKGKVVQGAAAPGDASLSGAPGGQQPTAFAQEQQSVQEYEGEIY
jgi:hypothetical protein